ncbi:MAG: hypothetical protein A2293_08335 [Elusimicrobia bacterium RIFOXYB2_FULL_49_7]|nr:MAG: hypothetical protein A2293_08335 [Elusimicrobia bacterium RIFOXYB2_FULL_49_7]
MNRFTYPFRYHFKKWSIILDTFLFSRQIRQAYPLHPALAHTFALSRMVTAHPFLTLLLPLVTILFSWLLLAVPFRAPSLDALFSRSHSARTLAPKAVPILQALPKKISSSEERKSTNRQSLYILVADKTAKLLRVIRFYDDNDFDTIKIYPMAIGTNWGRKEKAGDLKTPEGFYWLVNIFEDRELPPIYGVRAFVTNYPNEQDLRDGRTGTGIWIHGVEPGKAPDKTKGCLEIANENLKDISNFIGIGTPLLICEKVFDISDSIHKYFRFNELLPERETVLTRSRSEQELLQNFVEKWRVAWESRDIDQYTSLYNPLYKQDGMDFEQWKRYKEAIFRNSQSISVSVSGLKIQKKSGDTAFIRFLQDYESGTYKTQSQKELILTRSNGEWRIAQENKITEN